MLIIANYKLHKFVHDQGKVNSDVWIVKTGWAQGGIDFAISVVKMWPGTESFEENQSNDKSKHFGSRPDLD